MKIKLKTHIGSVADEFTNKDLLVWVEVVDDEIEKLVDRSICWSQKSREEGESERGCYGFERESYESRKRRGETN